MTDLQLNDIAATTEPFRLDVGPHAIVLSGEFNGATATLHRRVPESHSGEFLPMTEIAPFTRPDVQQWHVQVNAIGWYRLHIEPGSKPPAICLIIS